MQEGQEFVEQQMNGATKLDGEESTPETEEFERGINEDEEDDTFRNLLALTVWRDSIQTENYKIVQICYVSNSPGCNSSPAVPLPEHQLSATIRENSAGSCQDRQLAITTMRMALTADSFHLMTVSVERYIASLAEGQELMGQIPAYGISEDGFEWGSMFSFGLFPSEGGILPSRTEFLREDTMPDILPSLLCPSSNPLLYRLPILARSLIQVERVLQLRQHRIEAVLLRRRLLLALKQGHVKDSLEIEESSVPPSQRKRKTTEHIRQEDPSERQKRIFAICMQNDVPLGESAQNMGHTLLNPQEVKQELDKELRRLLDRHHDFCGWMGGGQFLQGEDCTGDSDDLKAQKTLNDVRSVNDCASGSDINFSNTSQPKSGTIRV